MKKFFSIFLLFFTLVFLFSGMVSAQADPTGSCTFIDAGGDGSIECSIVSESTCDNLGGNWTEGRPCICDESNGGQDGLVPCGRGLNPNGSLACRCEIYHIFILLNNGFNFIVWIIGIPLAALIVTTGGIMMILSGINQNFYQIGKNMLIASAIALAIIFGSWLIVNALFLALGYEAFGTSWWNFEWIYN